MRDTAIWSLADVSKIFPLYLTLHYSEPSDGAAHEPRFAGYSRPIITDEMVRFVRPNKLILLETVRFPSCSRWRSHARPVEFISVQADAREFDPQSFYTPLDPMPVMLRHVVVEILRGTEFVIHPGPEIVAEKLIVRTITPGAETRALAA